MYLYEVILDSLNNIAEIGDPFNSRISSTLLSKELDNILYIFVCW